MYNTNCEIRKSEKRIIMYVEVVVEVVYQFINYSII